MADTGTEPSFVIPGKALAWVVAYLQKRPYAEVVPIMGVLTSLPSVTLSPVTESPESAEVDQADAGQTS